MDGLSLGIIFRIFQDNVLMMKTNTRTSNCLYLSYRAFFYYVSWLNSKNKVVIKSCSKQNILALLVSF